MVEILTPSEDAYRQTAERLQTGGLVAFPTETVYGLGADATNDHAIAKIYEAKGRPKINPLIVHFYDLAAAEREVQFDSRARHLASVFWPGPLTLVLPRKPDSRISLLASAGLPTLAVRVPAHPVARKLLQTCLLALAAPSANRSGSLSPTTPQHVAESLGDAAGLILAGGKCVVGLESTVLDLSGPVPALLRHGAITVEELERHLGKVEDATQETGKPKSPGQLLRHYAPKTPLRLNAVDVKKGEALLGFGSLKFMGIEGGGWAKDLPDTHLANLSAEGDLTEAAANLFAMLHRLDAAGAKAIAVMNIPDCDMGRAINDRLSRAARAQAVSV